WRFAMGEDMTQTVDLLISHSQILIRSRAYEEGLSQWGTGNVSQGALLHPDYLIFDPLPDDAFGAKVILHVTSQFVLGDGCARCIVAPFHISDRSLIEVASATEKFKITLDLPLEDYAVYFEICEADEIFYRFTFVSGSVPGPTYLFDDPWGGVKGKALAVGSA
ncbi:MAG TPA: competence protein ComJ, partial [Paraburkholderia sp.]|uniref:competence protein ComJ n=1 Tax=Paraburkholderia sp. TaxID=1926495 RepID=UPI002DEB7774|nr:competence protein ComJ [Paraburkholderia sp.]